MARRKRRNQGEALGVKPFVRLTPKVALAGTALFLIAYQVRYSIETIEARDTFLYIPFQLKPCTNIVDTVGHGPARDAVHRGDELLAVNGRAFTGVSVYHQELRAATRYIDSVRLLPTERLTPRSRIGHFG